MSHAELTRGIAPEREAPNCGAARFRRIVVVCAVVASVALLAPFVLPSRVADLAVGLGGMAAMGLQGGCELWSTRRARGAERRWRLLLLTGWIGVAIGLLITSVRALFLGQNPLPPLSGTEPAYLAYIPASIAAVLAFPADPLRPEDEPAGTHGTRWKIVTVLDAVLLVGSLSLLGWVVVFGPLVRARAPAPASLGILLAFGLGCFLLLITVLLVGVFRRPRCRESFALLGGGLGSITVLLHVSLYFIASGRPEPLQLVASNTVGTMMIGLACIVPPRSRPRTDRAVRPAAVGLGSAPGGLVRWRARWAGWQAGQGPRWARLLLPYLPLAALGVLVAVQMATQTQVRPSVLLGVLLLVLVVLIRQLLTLADNMRLLDRVEQSRRQLRHQALHDPLTGLANRALFGDRLEHAVARRSRGRLSLLFCDLDDFKTVNDTQGHSVGDELLRLVARRLLGCVPPSDTVARLGGDEFAVLLEDETVDAEAAGRRVRAAVGAPCRLAGQPYAVQVSLGLAVAEPGSPISSESLLQQADLAMYAAKQRGKDRLVVYDPGIVAHSGSLPAHRALHQVLRGDPAGGVLDVLYQPIVDLTHGHPVAYQASARWRHPILGHLTGERTVAVAAGAGLSHQLEQAILDRACHDIGLYRRRTGKNVAVYVSVSVARPTRDLPADIETALAASDLPVQALVLRLSETERLDEQAADSLRTCAARGLRLALNGIAGNHNSLLSLDELPIEILMFDSSPGGRVPGGVGRADLLRRAVIAFAEDLDLTVIATGVQSRQQARSLARHGCRFGQGQLFGPPAALPGATGRPAA
ncbi:diguanylate cyclase (GGDEF) domain-containing protein [Parafrankia irregularis]|uniref:Diguanylate cyclase (GGDEF) domain-containing protein n=2 Tax=Parafrankia TaxID=2994362 RepID=A0A0S4QEH4_9ACTN|nr:diguanylate cyclase [Parafrankia sp. CH37]CUU53634.1 diguanylate cyclase (GGDEF) domain-containing protein [Parafrankia irregularis]